MKVYKLSEQGLKKRKKEMIIEGLLLSLFCMFRVYQHIRIPGVEYNITSTIVFGIAAFQIFFSSYKLDQCYLELDGKIIREYIKGKVRKESNLEQAQIGIKEHKKRPRISVLDENNKLAKYNSYMVGVEAFNELINDVKAIVNEQEE